MNLVDLIQATGGLPGDAAGIVAALNAKNIACSTDSLWNLPRIGDRYGETLAAAISGGLAATVDGLLAMAQAESDPAIAAQHRFSAEMLRDFRTSLATSGEVGKVGLNMNNAKIREKITALATAGAWSNDVRDALLALGRWNESLADRHNAGVDYTEAEVTAALAEIALRNNEAANEQWIAMVRNEFVNPNIRTMTQAEIAQAFVDAVEG